MANLRGKTVVIAVYRIYESEPFKFVKGKVKNIHTASGIRDESSITIETEDGKLEYHPQGIFSNEGATYFTIKEVCD